MRWIIFILIFMITYIKVDSESKCMIESSRMDCNSKGLTDCPPVNKSITELNLNGNHIKSLNSTLCRKWSHLNKLSASGNQLTIFVNLTLFNVLHHVNASHNMINEVSLVSNQIQSIDLSHNSITLVKPGLLAFLDTLYLGHNSLSLDVINLVFQSFLFPMLRTLDLSYNNLSVLPSAFSNFLPSYFSSLSLAGNKISSMRYDFFEAIALRPFTLDISHNLVNSLIITPRTKIVVLNVSHNLITSIDSVSLSVLVLMTVVDLSDNPLNCSCTFMPPFVAEMNLHKNTFINQASTNCQSSDGPNIFNPYCPPLSFSSTSWRWIVPLVVLLILIISFICYGVIRRRRSGYTEIGSSASYICFPLDWIKLHCLNSRNVTVDPINSERSFSDQRLNVEEKLIILCSSKNTGWVSKEIASHLRIDKEIINKKERPLPYSTFVLVVVDGDNDIRDSRLIDNVTAIISKKNTVDIRLLMRSIPSMDNLRRDNSLCKYITEEMSNKSHIVFDAEYPLTCIDNLKNWLNFYA